MVIACHWSGYPPVFEPLIEELAGDHRTVTYDRAEVGGAGDHGMGLL